MADYEVDEYERERNQNAEGYQGGYTGGNRGPITPVPQPTGANPTPTSGGGGTFETRFGYSEEDARRLGYTDVASLNRANAGTLLTDLAKKYNVTVDQGDIESLINRSQYGRYGGNLNLAAADFEGQYARRADNRPRDRNGRLIEDTTERPQSAFSDPIGGPINDYANERFSRLTNPPAGSGQALLEDALRRISAQFQNGGFTPGELEQLQTQAIDPLERLRTARKQQVMQNLSARNIDPNSGVGRSMLADVDRQFDGLRSQQQTQIGTQAARETQTRMLQALEMLSGLASTEEGRLDKAFNYRTVPLQLADRSFNQALQLYGQANPMNLFNPAMQLASIGQGQQSGRQNALALLASLLLN